MWDQIERMEVRRSEAVGAACMAVSFVILLSVSEDAPSAARFYMGWFGAWAGLVLSIWPMRLGWGLSSRRSGAAVVAYRKAMIAFDRDLLTLEENLLDGDMEAVLESVFGVGGEDALARETADAVQRFDAPSGCSPSSPRSLPPSRGRRGARRWLQAFPSCRCRDRESGAAPNRPPRQRKGL